MRRLTSLATHTPYDAYLDHPNDPAWIFGLEGFVWGGFGLLHGGDVMLLLHEHGFWSRYLSCTCHDGGRR